MSFENTSKINKLLREWKTGTVCLTSWLTKKGISSQLLNRYKKSGWLESIGTGAVIRSGDEVDYLGGLYAIQHQAKQNIHVGGRTALAFHGQAQYLEMSAGRAIIMGSEKETLPHWFKSKNWETRIDYYRSSFLPPTLGIVELSVKNFSVKFSSPARAIMECLYLAPKHQAYYECYELMEGLFTLRPKSVQELLENCSSIKVKRLFLYLAEKVEHPWLKQLDISKIELGSGKRSLATGGVYIDKYKITVPKEFEKNEIPEI